MEADVGQVSSVGGGDITPNTKPRTEASQHVGHPTEGAVVPPGFPSRLVLTTVTPREVHRTDQTPPPKYSAEEQGQTASAVSSPTVNNTNSKRTRCEPSSPAKRRNRSPVRVADSDSEYNPEEMSNESSDELIDDESEHQSSRSSSSKITSKRWLSRRQTLLEDPIAVAENPELEFDEEFPIPEDPNDNNFDGLTAEQKEAAELAMIERRVYVRVVSLILMH